MKIYGKTVGLHDEWRRPQHESVFVNPGKSVTLKTSTMLRGITKTGKNWNRWEDQTTYSFYRNNTGLIIPIHKVQKKWHNASRTCYLLDNTRRSEGEDLFVNTLNQEFGVKNITDIFPALNYRNLNPIYSIIPQSLLRAFRANTNKEFTELIFGKSRYSIDLDNAVSSANLTSIVIAQQFAGLVHIDWIIKFLEQNRCSNDVFNIKTELRYLLTRIHPNSYYNLLNTPVDDFALISIKTSIATVKYAKRTRQKLFVDASTSVSNFNELKRRLDVCNNENSLIPISRLTEDLEGSTFGKNYSIRMAYNLTTLDSWSRERYNCIGSFESPAIKGESIFGAVYYKSKVVANFSITNDYLDLLIGRFNQPLNTSLQLMIKHHLEKYHVIVSY